MHNPVWKTWARRLTALGFIAGVLVIVNAPNYMTFPPPHPPAIRALT